MPVLVATVLFASPVLALDITNEDDQNYTVDVIVDQGDPEVESFALESGATMIGICPDGCELLLSNGLSRTFTGPEEVVIMDGEFVVAD